ncbi:MAG: AAA family ATPase, partial [Actinomycetota bacterium]
VHVPGPVRREDDERFLVRRPLLRALESGGGSRPVLLVDEIDRADDEFEAFLLEFLSEWAVTVPELGAVRAGEPPIVVLTSNRTRDVHDALKRRCLYHWIDHPDREREVEIVRRRAPEAGAALAAEVAALVSQLRDLDLYKPPGVAESIAWAEAVSALGCASIDARTADLTLGAVVKYREDQERVRAHGLAALIGGTGAGARPPNPVSGWIRTPGSVSRWRSRRRSGRPACRCPPDRRSCSPTRCP